MLARGTVGRVLAAVGGQYWLLLPDGRSGFVRAADVTTAATAVTSASHQGSVLESPRTDAIIVTSLDRGRRLPVRGYFGEFALVELPDTRLGWALIESQ
jgi:hypothetical protein